MARGGPVSCRVAFDRSALADFCRRWKITKFAIFGSALRDDFRADSDVDVLVSFAPDAEWGLHALCEMERELRALFGRDVDLVTRGALEQSENYIRRNEVLSHLEVIHASR